MIQAFNSELKPYAEFEWVSSPTSRRHLARNASQTPARPPATAATSVAGTFKHTKPPQNNRRSGPATAGLIKAEPPPDAPRGPRNHIPSRAPRFSHLDPDPPRSPSQNLGKAPVRSGGAPLGPLFRPPSMQPQRFADSRASSTSSSSVSSSWDPPEMVHLSQRPRTHTTGPLNTVARDQSSARTFDPPERAHLSPESTRYSGTPSQHEAQHEAGRARMPYSPTPGPSSYGPRQSAKPTTNIRSPSKKDTKTPEPLDGKKGMASAEIGTPRLYSTYKDLPSTSVQEPVAPQLSKAAGKQPMRSASSSVAASTPAASQAHSTNESQACKSCTRKHAGDCIPFCGNCGKRHSDPCHHCGVCSKWHQGGDCRYCEKCNSWHWADCRECTRCNTWHVGPCKVCTTCGKRHGGVCPSSKPSPESQLSSSGRGERVTSSATESLEPRKKTTTPLPNFAATRVETPLRARTRDATTSTMPGISASTRSAETSDDESEACKHRQKGKECLQCGCGCGSCHRPDRLCSKQRAEARAGKRKADDPDVKVEPSVSDMQLSLIPRQKKARVQESVDPVVKVEEPAMQLRELPKKKKKPRKRESVGSWYDPIDVN